MPVTTGSAIRNNEADSSKVDPLPCKTHLRCPLADGEPSHTPASWKMWRCLTAYFDESWHFSNVVFFVCTHVEVCGSIYFQNVSMIVSMIFRKTDRISTIFWTPTTCRCHPLPALDPFYPKAWPSRSHSETNHLWEGTISSNRIATTSWFSGFLPELHRQTLASFGGEAFLMMRPNMKLVQVPV